VKDFHKATFSKIKILDISKSNFCLLAQASRKSIFQHSSVVLRVSFGALKGPMYSIVEAESGVVEDDPRMVEDDSGVVEADSGLGEADSEVDVAFLRWLFINL
jgi:hypothetical protein